MRFEKISPKQAEIFKFMAEPYDALICDGAVRSGKTTMMSVAFVEWAMSRFDGCNFGICGKTVRSAERNIIMPLVGTRSVTRKYSITYARSLSLMTVRRGHTTNYFYIFGGKDESSYTLIQGITLSGVLFDEVALMPESFVNQALARTLTEDDAKSWFNCNPEAPGHWFHTKWVLQPEQHNAKHLHFLMTDNPGNSEKALAKAERDYSGVFYKRYVLGLWVSAEGTVYSRFADNPQGYTVTRDWLNGRKLMDANIGVDFGGNGSGHAFVCTGFERGLKSMATLAEWYHKGEITPEKLESEFVDFAKMCSQEYGATTAYCDSAETTLIMGLRAAVMREHIPLDVVDAQKGPINDRIRFLCRLMAAGRYHVMDTCPKLIDALTTAVWDSKHVTEDVRLDNGSTNIDSLDALEYSFEPYMESMINLGGGEAAE